MSANFHLCPLMTHDNLHGLHKFALLINQSHKSDELTYLMLFASADALFYTGQGDDKWPAHQRIRLQQQHLEDAVCTPPLPSPNTSNM